MDPLQAVRTSTKRVALRARHVQINEAALERLAEGWSSDSSLMAFQPWSESSNHFVEQPVPTERTLQYVLVLDTLNFCFWPCQWEYEQLAKALSDVLAQNAAAFSADSLARLTEDELSRWLAGSNLPLMSERTRLLNEVGVNLNVFFEGSIANLVRQAKGKASELVRLILAYFPGFRDTAIHCGEQVFFYKRAQIFVGDVWGAFSKQGLGQFGDMEEITMFADYRVPQILRACSVLEYAPELAEHVDSKKELAWGSAEEVEIRAATVYVTELLREALQRKGVSILSVELDWLLWQKGELEKDSIAPHHRILSVYY
eukprot:GILK01002628.1.p1 GENE.GILK01002628.1~~GILK01002628.1.p1  ORF type:complete len:325 (+),score=45.16 GILK01002628.1:32-976(+)